MKFLRGYKRHIGAIVLIVLYALRLFGVDVPEGTEKILGSIGAGIFGVGWLDRWIDGPHKG